MLGCGFIDKDVTKVGDKIMKNRAQGDVMHRFLSGCLRTYRVCQRVHLPFTLIVCCLVLVGIAAVTTASFAIGLSNNNDAWFYTRRQIVAAAVGIVMFAVCSTLPVYLIKKIATPLFVISGALLVLVPFIGRGALGAKRWITLGPIQIQPSEIVKFAVILFIAFVLSRNPARVKSLISHLLHVGLCVGLCVVTERQPDLGTAMCIGIGFFATLWVGNINKLQLFLLGGIVVCGVVGLVFISGSGNSYRVARFEAIRNPAAFRTGASMQNWRSLVALANGGVTGLGPGQSREKRLGGVPMQRTDFIYAVIGEEFGLMGTLGILGLYVALLATGLRLSMRATDPFARYVIAGVTCSIVGQAFLNMAVVVGAVPATGIPLPLISFGGTSLVVTLGSLGIVAALSRKAQVKRSNA